MIPLAPNGRFRLGVNTMANLDGVHPRLVDVARRAIQLTTVDFCVLPGGGVRSTEQALTNFERGKGIKNSLHIRQSDGYSHAMDLVAYENGRHTYGRKNDRADRDRLYLPIRAAVLQASAELGVPIQHGADWDVDGVPGEPGEWDWPHWQFPKLPARIEAARKQMNEIRALLGMVEI